MKHMILARYLYVTILKMFCYVLAFIWVLQSMAWMVGEMHLLGQGSFHFGQIFLYTSAQMPMQLCLLAPQMVFIAVVLGLGQLVGTKEFLIMQLAGLTPWRLMRLMVVFGLMLSVVIMLSFEYLAPKSAQWASQYKLKHLSQGQMLSHPTGLWIRTFDGFIYGTINVNHNNSCAN